MESESVGKTVPTSPGEKQAERRSEHVGAEQKPLQYIDADQGPVVSQVNPKVEAYEDAEELTMALERLILDEPALALDAQANQSEETVYDLTA